MPWWNAKRFKHISLHLQSRIVVGIFALHESIELKTWRMIQVKQLYLLVYPPKHCLLLHSRTDPWTLFLLLFPRIAFHQALPFLFKELTTSFSKASIIVRQYHPGSILITCFEATTRHGHCQGFFVEYRTGHQNSFLATSTTLGANFRPWKRIWQRQIQQLHFQVSIHHLESFTLFRQHVL